MGKIIAFANQKGGVGKTTSCVNVSAYMAAMGKKVLVVDIDPQGNATSGYGLRKNKLQRSVYSLLIDGVNPLEAIHRTGVDNLYIIPSNIDLAGAEVELVPFSEREKVLKKVLQRLKNEYDYVCIDCPPSLGLLTINALAAADSVLIPIQGEFFALEGLSQLMNTIKLVKKILNPSLEIEGVALTLYDPRSNLVLNVADEITKLFGKKVFTTKIPRNVRLGEAPSYGLPIMQYEPRSSGALAYKALTEEVLQRNNDKYIKIVSDRLLRKRLPPQGETK